MNNRIAQVIALFLLLALCMMVTSATLVGASDNDNGHAECMADQLRYRTEDRDFWMSLFPDEEMPARYSDASINAKVKHHCDVFNPLPVPVKLYTRTLTHRICEEIMVGHKFGITDKANPLMINGKQVTRSKINSDCLPKNYYWADVEGRYGGIPADALMDHVGENVILEGDVFHYNAATRTGIARVTSPKDKMMTRVHGSFSLINNSVYNHEYRTIIFHTTWETEYPTQMPDEIKIYGTILGKEQANFHTYVAIQADVIK